MSPWLESPNALTHAAVEAARRHVNVSIDTPVPRGPTAHDAHMSRPGERNQPLQPLPSRIPSRHGYRELPLAHTPRTIFVRSELIARLDTARALLPDGFDLLVLDGWRSPEFQEELVQYYRERTGARTLDGFVSDPGDDALIAPHTTGGALDLTLSVNGVAVGLGTDWDAFTDRAALSYFEDTSQASARTTTTAHAEHEGEEAWGSPCLIRSLRRMLAAVLIEAGFAPFATEWWHWSFGDQYWAAFYGHDRAEYGRVESAPDAPHSP